MMKMAKTLKQIVTLLNDDSGDALQNLLWIFVYGIGAAAMIGGIVLAVNRFSNRTITGVDGINAPALTINGTGN